MKLSVLILFIFLGWHSTVLSQNCEKVLFSGKVVDTIRPNIFYNLMVINKSSGRGVFGQPNGTFAVYASEGDTIALSVRDSPSLVLVVIKPDSNCQHIGTYYIESKIQEIEQVEVRPLKSLEQIKEERAALAMRETRLVTGIEVLQSPITALYQAFSKTEQSKRQVAEWEHLDNQREILKELLRNYVAYEIVDLTNEEFDDFIVFLNMDETFLKTATEMELITFIKDKYQHYKRLKE